MCDTFADGGIERVGGHPEIELGLVELARETGEARHLAQAATFVRRPGTGTLGEIPFGQAYFQDDVPVAPPPSCGGTPCGRCTSRPAPSTSPSTRATTSCSAS